jgi:hypothetical protein
VTRNDDDNNNNMRLETFVVGFTIGSRGEVPGRRKPVTREQHNSIQFNLLFLCAASTAKRPITDTAQQQ